MNQVSGKTVSIIQYIIDLARCMRSSNILHNFTDSYTALVNIGWKCIHISYVKVSIKYQECWNQAVRSYQVIDFFQRYLQSKLELDSK